MGVRELVHQAISWGKVEERLGKYPAIGRAFPTQLLQRGADTAPYYCHPMAWRMCVWLNEDNFATLDRLLGVAETVPRWKQEQQQLAPI